jgi:hypothetical protein
MHNQMMADGCNVEKTQAGLPLAVFWVVALVGFGFLIGAGREPVATITPEIGQVLPAQTTTEDWHGNVRRGG